MKRKSRGQALVEFALIFPMLMFSIFMIIDFGFYIYGWSTVQFSARRGAEQASRMQPRELASASSYQQVQSPNDPCLELIIREARRSGGLSPATTVQRQEMFITFHTDVKDTAGTTNPAANPKARGNIVQVRVEKQFEPLTPLSKIFLGNRKFHFNAISRRTIVANGPTFPMVEGKDNYNMCKTLP